MKKVLIAAAVLIVAGPAAAQGQYSTRGYVRSDGTYVAPHYSTNPNSTRMDNWSTRGNVNPYTGRAGTVDPYSTPSYRSPYTSSGSTSRRNPW